MCPFETRERVVGLRPPLGGLPSLDPVPGTVALRLVMIGTVTFDGLSQGPLWKSLSVHLVDAVDELGIGARCGDQAGRHASGCCSACCSSAASTALGIEGARSVGGGCRAERLRRAFIHSLVPIAMVYVAAHYLTFLLFEGQAIGYLASDPFGRGWNLFGTASAAIDYGLLSQYAAWYLQVGFVVVGHVAALVLAHDRALVLYRRGEARRALAVLDARRHGRLHQPRAVAAGAGRVRGLRRSEPGGRPARQTVPLDRGDLFLLRHAEGGAAAAGRDDVRVLDLEAGALQALDVVDDRAPHVREARAVDEHAEAVVLEDLVAVALGVERERVLEAGAAAAAHADAQAGGLHVGALRRQELLDLLGAFLGEGDHVSYSSWSVGSNTSRSVAAATLYVRCRRTDELKQRIEAAIPGPRADVIDLTGGGDHFRAESSRPSSPG